MQGQFRKTFPGTATALAARHGRSAGRARVAGWRSAGARRGGAVVALLAVLAAAMPAAATFPNPDTVPYTKEWFAMDFPGGHGGLGSKLMWEQTDLAKPNVQADARAQCQAYLRRGLNPMWEMAWDDPKAKGPGFDQYTAWKQSHQQYWMCDRSGKNNPEAYYNDAISAAMPYDRADLPAGLAAGTRNDWELPRLVALAKATGAVGYFAADKYDLGWAHYQTTDKYDFNPRMIDAFAAKSGVKIPAGTTAERSAHIVKNCFSEWTDFICESIAIRHTQLIPELKKLGVEHPIIAFQVDFNVTANRIKGLDMRMVAKRSAFGEVLKRVEMQADAGRPPMDKSCIPSFFGLWACRTPDAMHGGQMCSDHPEFWAGARKVFADDALRPEWGRKYLRQHWLGVGWWQIANADGSVRRAVCEWTRTYWDGGKAPEDAVSLVRSIKPTRPFGLAFYYSVPVERAYEQTYPSTGQLYPMTGGYGYAGGKAHDAQHAGLAVGYSVSDAAIDKLQAANYPTGWLTSGTDKMPAAELAALKRIAPVYDMNTIADLGSIPSPVKFSAGACGYAFQDQNSRSIFLIWRQGRGPKSTDDAKAGNTPVDCTVSFSGIRDGAYTVEDLFQSANKYTVTIAGGRGSFTFPLDRWDCRALASNLPPPSSGGNPTPKAG